MFIYTFICLYVFLCTDSFYFRYPLKEAWHTRMPFRSPGFQTYFLHKPTQSLQTVLSHTSNYPGSIPGLLATGGP